MNDYINQMKDRKNILIAIIEELKIERNVFRISQACVLFSTEANQPAYKFREALEAYIK